MTSAATLQDRITAQYGDLSGKLQVAADYVASNPLDMATRSLRSIATTSGVSPATFSRLARKLGYTDYEEMREQGRAAMERRMGTFSDRAQALRAGAGTSTADAFLYRQAAACITNIEALNREMQPKRLDAAVGVLHRAETVLLVGSLGSSGFVDYFGYLAHWFRKKWHVAGRNGTTLAATMARLGPGDAVLALAKAPYARRTVAALKAAHARGIPTLVITDSHASPALAYADQSFVVPSESPQFFSSYTATLVLIETIITMLLTRAGEEAEEMIRAAEAQIHDLGETWAP